MSLGAISLHTARMLRHTLASKIKNISRTAFDGRLLFYTNVSISFTLSGLGDFLEQQYEILSNRMPKWDRERTCKMAISGITVGIVCHHYYSFLDRKLPGRSFKMLMKKLLIDQFICSPLCIATFFLTVAFLENSSWQEFVQNTGEKAWRLYTAEWIIWPPAQVINFYFLPPKYRVLYDSTISLGYDIYTSYVNHDKPHTDNSDS